MHDSRNLRIAAIFIVALTSFLGTLVAPIVIRVATWAQDRKAAREAETQPADGEAAALGRDDAAAGYVQRVLRVLGALSTGIVLGTSTLHLLPEAIIFMDEATGEGPVGHSAAAAQCANGTVATSPASDPEAESPAPPFPYAELIMVLTAFAMFFFEKEVFAFVERRAKRKAAKKEAKERRTTVSQASEPTTCESDAHAVPIPASDESGKNDADNALAVVYSHVVELALSIHSVILGLTLGLLTEYGTVRVLVIAVAIDQFSDGVAVGATLSESKSLSWCHAGSLRTFFAWTCSLGIAIGVGIEQRGGSADPMAQGILAAMSAGLLLLLAMSEMLPGIIRPFSRRNGQLAATATAATESSQESSQESTAAEDDDDEAVGAGSVRPSEITINQSAKELTEAAAALSAPWRWLLYLCMCVGFAVMAVIAVYGG